MKTMKGQFTVIALVMVFVSLIVFVVLYPVIASFIATFVAGSSDTTLNAIVQLLPFFIVLAIIMSIVFYMIPRGQGSPQGY